MIWIQHDRGGTKWTWVWKDLDITPINVQFGWCWQLIYLSFPHLYPAPSHEDNTFHVAVIVQCMSSPVGSIFITIISIIICYRASQVGLVVKNSPANAGDKICRLSSWVGRSPGGRYGNPFQYSYLANPMDREAWQAMVHRITELDTTEWLRT